VGGFLSRTCGKALEGTDGVANALSGAVGERSEQANAKHEVATRKAWRFIRAVPTKGFSVGPEAYLVGGSFLWMPLGLAF
jgi:hypothetical protein